MKTSVLLDHEPVADGGFLVRALLRIEGDSPQDDDRVPLNLSLVRDRSGSMSGEPLRAAREAAVMLVRRLRMEDVVSVVAYDDDVHVVALPSTGETQEGLAERIREIQTGGMTNLSGGWLRARELVSEHALEDGVNRVMLLTGGQANQGVTDPERLQGLCRMSAEGAPRLHEPCRGERAHARGRRPLQPRAASGVDGVPASPGSDRRLGRPS